MFRPPTTGACRRPKISLLAIVLLLAAGVLVMHGGGTAGASACHRTLATASDDHHAHRGTSTSPTPVAGPSAVSAQRADDCTPALPRRQVLVHAVRDVPAPWQELGGAVHASALCQLASGPEPPLRTETIEILRT